jgi:acyl-CoA synthetase (AMP-forming)/AMP-acid ligase II|tara:strand:- start:3259 stop:4758 length:1500 start_codon:yes stop_codon:yes gene_type:complete
MNIMMLLEMATDAFGDRVAFTDSSAGSAITYQELYNRSGHAAFNTRESGCSSLGILDVTSLAVPVALFASAWSGVPFIPLNYRLTDTEIEALLARMNNAYLVTDGERATSFEERTDLTVVTRDRFLQAESEQLADPWSMDPEDTAVLLFTSGTTGVPKAAVLRQKHLVSYILGSVEFASAEEDETALVCVPPYHIAGIAAVLSSVYSGRRVVQLPNFAATDWIDVARTECITTAFVVPTMLARIVEALEGESSADMPHLRTLSYGGGKMPLAVLERAMQLFPEADLTNAYGLTETSSTISVLGPEEHREAAASSDDTVRRRLVSVGRALPGIEIEIRDDDGGALEANVSGEIFVRGEQVSGEYEGIGHLVDDDGWFPTRDRGSMDEEGYLFLEGRADDLIVRGGENLSPGEIEDVMLQYDAVADVAVVGIPDVQWGEAVVAVVVLKAGQEASAEQLQNWVKERMRSSRVPRDILFWDELPYNPTGKLLRRVIKTQLEDA